jgi:two-component system, OmpR family, heavy metal sensor histidine kinase CusS
VIDRLRHSLVLKLALAFAFTNLVLVGLGGAYQQFALGQILVQEAEDDLREETALIVQRLNEAPDRAVRDFRDISGHFKLRVFDFSDHVVYQSAGIEATVPLQSRPALSDPEAIENYRDSHGIQLKIFYAPFVTGHVQVIRDFSFEARRISKFRETMALRLTLTVITAALIGYVLARKGLAPLRHLADQASRIQPESLSTRVRLEGTERELQPLVEALNKSLARLEEAFARLSELSADMAHELRTPVHALRLETERILTSPELPDATEDALVGMAEALDHLGAMIEQMLFLAKSEDPSTVIEAVDLNLSRLLESVKEPFESLAEERGIRLQCEASANLHIRGDGTLLRRALHNLVDNATRYAPEGSTVVLRAHELPNAIVLEVSDQGEGIPEQFLTTLGRRFIRSDQSRSRATGGAGLGLAIVQSIAKLHGANFEIHSRAGEGTRSCLVFPRT